MDEILNRINFNQLYYFYIVAKEGSIKSASEKLHISQPSISVQLKNLEEEIGVSLFVRQHRKLILTEFGEKLKLSAENLFLLADEIVAALPTMGKYPKEKFNLGVLKTVPINFVVNFSSLLWTDILLETTVLDFSREGLLSGLDNGSLDFVLSDAMEVQSERYMSINLGSSKIVAFTKNLSDDVCHEEFPLCLGQLPYLSFFSNGQMQTEIDHYFLRHKISPPQFGKIDSIPLMKLMVEKNSCFSILPTCSLDEELRSGTFHNLGELPDIHFTLWAIFPKSSAKKVNIMNCISSYLENESSPEDPFTT